MENIIDPNQFDRAVLIGHHVEGEHSDIHCQTFGDWTLGDMAETIVNLHGLTLSEIEDEEKKKEFISIVLSGIHMISTKD